MKTVGSGTADHLKSSAVTVLVTVLVGLFVALSALSGYPLRPIFSEIPYIRALFRIGFGALFITQYVRMPSGPTLLFGNDKKGRFDRKIAVGVYAYHAVPWLAAALVVGLLTDIAAILLLIAHAISIRESKYYSIEDIQMQLISFFFPWLGLGAVLSIDSIVGIDSFLSSPILFNAFFVTFGVFLFSSGFEKIKTDIWRTGEAAGFFLNSPHLVRKEFHKFVKYIPLRTSAYVVMFAELLFIVSSVSKWTLAVCIFCLAGFAVGLFTIAGISFIGETLLLTLLLFGGAVATNWNIFPQYSILFNIEVEPISIAATVIVLCSFFVIMWPKQMSKIGITDLVQVVTGINTPIKVFNRKHLFGIYTYQLQHVDEDGETLTVLPTFTTDGYLGPYQRFHPRIYQSAMYPVTDYCLRLLRSESPSNELTEKVGDLCAAATEIAELDTGKLRLKVKPYDAHKSEQYLSNSWKTVAEWEIQSEELIQVAIPEKPKIISR